MDIKITFKFRETLAKIFKKEIEELNKSNNYKIDSEELKGLVEKHRVASRIGNKILREKIEYRLNDINFKKEAKLLREGKYSEVLKLIKG